MMDQQDEPKKKQALLPKGKWRQKVGFDLGHFCNELETSEISRSSQVSVINVVKRRILCVLS
jgi:hypothetical protein